MKKKNPEDYLEGQKHCAQLKDQTDALTGHLNMLYACESWTLTAGLEKMIQATEMRCYRRLLDISYKDHISNAEVRNRVTNSMKIL